MNNIIKFDGYTRLDINPNDVLEGAGDKLERCLVVGEDEDGDLYLAASTSKLEKIFWLLKRAEIEFSEIYKDGN